MPELPEVETTCRGIAPLITDCQIAELVLRTDKLRWPLDRSLCVSLPGQTIRKVERRAKYLLLHCNAGALILHLGMSGSLRVIAADSTENKHDHVDLIFTNGSCLRFNDPRKFGALLWCNEPKAHPLLVKLGPEPLSAGFDGEYLWQASRQRKTAIKPFIMDQKLVVGVGNIYASESLFRAGIRPQTAAGKVSRARYQKLSAAIKEILTEAIAAGGTTIADFKQADGKPGYFAQQLQVYGRDGEPCPQCGQPISSVKLGQRSTCFCRNCQK
ncbi:DNA-(apurinic or apyrimidinic site) lyase [Malonomonas rubra DSM 5091]|uniref:Formamidopyrimidine-DNA glycosylase n=1 Tax=Malonomonas rubra DSM 5091 TaxID=1122189 RepID=A0A1M6C9P9_MALRU|nr:bifunctional DNA-formamidopyrimidine glycosylase/DNA-(apurinic or apyrimidinic site) lyase [Malonomonas rubra]SHI57745.1 DNA-(apurinic or apyrimidinic site) lyase [Malonomonas rubra DSM 5091]